jgi:hypothetical protein
VSRQKPIAISLAIVAIQHELRRHGFMPVDRSSSGTCYVSANGSPFKMRISDHLYVHPERHPDVLRSIIVTEPMTQDEIAARCVIEAAEFEARVQARHAGLTARERRLSFRGRPATTSPS